MIKFILISMLSLIGMVFCDDYIFETDKLPATDVMPTLANGHVGFTVFEDSILMNGLYNGFMGYSHRARIPNFANIQIAACENEARLEETDCQYRLIISNGIFETILTTEDYKVEHVVYAHRYFDRAIVNQFQITRLAGEGEIIIKLFGYPGIKSLDIDFGELEDVIIEEEDFIMIKGMTIDWEDPNYQLSKRRVVVLYQDYVEELIVEENETSKIFQFITLVDFDEEVVHTEASAILSLSPQDIKQSHINHWQYIWDNYDITAEGNTNLAKSIHSSIFFLTSSLPSFETNQPRNDFYGLAPGGLGKGGYLLKEYQGHSFWDTEMWMHPPLLLLEPEWSKILLHYRYMSRQAALDIARLTNYKGMRFPWESAYTGREVTPPCCPEVVLYQHHITADIAFAVRSHLFATHDMDWMVSEGCFLAVKTAEFWESRIKFNNETQLYEIRNVMGPDEDHHNISNNVYTNVVAGYNLYFGEFASCVCAEVLELEDYEKIDRWSMIAKSLTILYDETENYNPQYEGYEKGTIIKQADTVLLGFPLQYQIDDEIKRNNLHIYESVTREDGPAMTWAMHVIGHLDIDEDEEAGVMFKKSYDNYMRKPFMVWTEVTEGNEGVGNFLTGAGGFLQAVINGYMGIRLHMDRLQISNSKLPPNTNNLVLNGLTYLGSTFKVELNSDEILMTVKSVNPDIPLSIYIGATRHDVTKDMSYQIQLGYVVTIKTGNNPFGDCFLSDNKMGIPVDISSSTSLVFNKLFLIVFILVNIFIMMFSNN